MKTLNILTCRIKARILVVYDMTAELNLDVGFKLTLDNPDWPIYN